MHRALTALGVLGALLLAHPSWAITWQKNCQTGSSVTSISTGGTACASPASATDDTDTIDVRQCENIDVGVAEDQNGDATGGSAYTATLQWCPVAESDATVNTDAEEDLACVDFPSGTITGSGTIQGAGVPSGWVKLQSGGTHAGDPQIWLKCNGAIR